MKGKFILTASLATLLGLGVSVGVHHARVQEAKAYGKDDTTWFVAHEGNEWKKNDAKDHLTYTKDVENNWEFESDYYISLAKDEKFNIVYSWNEGEGYNTFTPELLSNSTDFTHPNDTDYFVANRAIEVKFFLQIYGESASWTGLYWQEKEVTTEYDVTTHVKKGEDTAVDTVKVAEGKLPDVPALEFGEEFSGWYEDGEYETKATGVTADCDLFGMINKADEVTYGVASHAFTPTHVYAYNDKGENAKWPGVALAGTSVTLPKDAKIVLVEAENEVVKNQTVDIEPGKAGDTLVIVKKQVGGEGEDKDKYYAGYAEANDIPLQEGHYVVSSGNEYKFADATKMVTYGEPDKDGNIAFLEELTVVAEQGIHVRSYFNGEDTWFYGNDHDKDYGQLDGDTNFVFSKGGKFSVYAKWEEVFDDQQQKNVSVPRFYTAPKVDTYDVTVKNVLLGVRGASNTVVDGEKQYAVVGGEFEPSFPKVSGYAVYEEKAYVDEACTEEYVKAASKEGLTIYIKYLKEGVYVVGDQKFVGQGNPEWSPLGGFRLTDDVQDPANVYEGSVTVPELASEETAKAKPYMVSADGSHYIDDSVLGSSSYDFVTQETEGDKNYVFSKAGTYGVFVKVEQEGEPAHDVTKVYFNAGLGAFCAKFLSQVGDTCDADGKTVVANLQLVWADQEAAYNSLTADEQKVLKDIGFDGGKEDGTNEEKVIAKYAYIVNKYGTAKFVDFIWSQNIAGKAVINEPTVRMNNTMTLVIIISAGVLTTISLGLLFVLKKKRFNNK